MSATRTRSRSRSPVRNRRPREKRAIDPNSDRMVFLNNLPFDLKWNELKDIIREKINESAFVEFIEDESGKPKGCAVLDFDSHEAAVACVEALNRYPIGGRTITAKEIRDPVGFFRRYKADTGIDYMNNRNVQASARGRFRPRREEEAGPYDNETYGLSPAFLDNLNIKPPLVNRVFVSNIAYNCSVGKIYEVFALAGRITWIDLQLDAEGKTRGMAVVQFSHPIEAVQAISMLDNQRLLDRVITVKMDRFEKEPERRPGELPAGLRAIGMGLGANGAPLADIQSVLTTLSTTRQPQIQQPIQPFSNPALNGVAAGGYGASVGAAAAAQPVPAYVPPVQAPVVPEPISSAYGSASGGYNATPQSNAGFGAPQQPPQTGGYGSQMGFSANKFYDNAPTRVILIKNLPVDYNWQIVNDRVQKFGDVEHVEIISPGVAKVRFVRVVDAERSKNTLSGTTVEGRVIAIEYL